MRKIILSIILCLFFSFAFSQARIGYTKNDIKKEYEHNLNFKILKDGHGEFFQVKLQSSITYYYFDMDDLCYMTIIVPNGILDKESLIRDYNSRYKKTSNDKWELKEKFGTCNIELRNQSNGGYYFLWRKAF